MFQVRIVFTALILTSLYYFREVPDYPPLGASETTVSVVTTIYSSVTPHSVSPSQVSQTTVSMPSSSQPSITTSSPSSIPTTAETHVTNTTTTTPVQSNSTPVATVQTAAILAAAHATATATATAFTASKLSSGPPGSPASDAANKPAPQPISRPQTAPTHLPAHQQLERRMSTPLTPINPLLAALSGPAQYPDMQHQLNQHMMTPLSDPMLHGLPLELHPQPPPPYNHLSTQRVLQLPPAYQDVASLHAAVSPMQAVYTPNKLPHQVLSTL